MRLVSSALLFMAVLLCGCSDELAAAGAGATPSPLVGCTLQGPTVAPAAVTIAVADTVRLRATLSACDDPSDTTRFTWQSSDTLVARVDSSGLVRGVSKGAATIIASEVQAPTVQGAGAITVVPR